MMLVDHHCHLDFPDFADERDAIVERAASAGVGVLVTISTRIDRYDTYRAIAEAYPNVYFSVGTHPHQAHEELHVSPEEIARLAGHPKCVAVGEAGLDYYYKKSPPEAQADGFRRHIAAARLTGLPLEIHTRDADADTIAILEDEMAKGPFKAVLHCFTGGAELARRAVAIGLCVSFSGVLTFRKSDALRAIAADIPLDRLLVETDAPFLAPDPFRGKRNEPAHVVHTAAVLAKVKGLPLSDLAAATSDNFFRFYTKAKRPSIGSRAA
jgi:TatD DNase family protein